MPLIECPDCGKQVSDAAVSCPQCGRPIAPAQAAAPQAVQTVQATSKDWKALRAIGAAMCFFGLLAIPAFDEKTPAAVAALLGLVLYLFARFGAWWNHG